MFGGKLIVCTGIALAVDYYFNAGNLFYNKVVEQIASKIFQSVQQPVLPMENISTGREIPVLSDPAIAQSSDQYRIVIIPLVATLAVMGLVMFMRKRKSSEHEKIKN